MKSWKNWRWILILLIPALCGCVFAYRPPEQAASSSGGTAAATGLPGHPEVIWSDSPAQRGRAVAINSETFAALAEQVNPAVVNIFSLKNVRTAVGDPLGLFRIRTPNLDFSAQALGTGFFISAKGFLLTNAHVVAGADEVKIFYWQTNEVKNAMLIGIDRTSDLALLKVDHKEPVPFLPLADSDAVRIGEWVIAVGNPFGLDHSLTNGLISAKHRRLQEGRRGMWEDYLQTNAQINPGNSGGPLVDLFGAVVGVNTATVRGGQGIGFAVPSNLTKEVIPHLVRAGRVQRAFVGVLLADVTGNIARSLGVPAGTGAVISRVERSSPAESAGLRANDVLLAVNGRQVHDAIGGMRTLSLLISGRKVKLTVSREGKKLSLMLVPERAQETRARR